MKLLKFLAIVGVAIGALLALMPNQPLDLSKVEKNEAQFEELDFLVGCQSQYSDEKKKQIFTEAHKGKVFTWTGTVSQSDDGAVDLDLNNGGLPDLRVRLADKKQGFDLVKGQTITVQFVMNVAGGCFLPFSGDSATII
ncbi:hypothetical protein EYU44_18640 [Vibrio cholerae]|nr:hypothetical protein [Vibrio cholerae]EGR0939046.1 hypothetical protein [Vibrio cholerae]